MSQLNDQLDDRPPTDVGFAPGEIRIDEPTRSARLKWIIAVDDELPKGLAANAVACVAAATGRAVDGIIGPDGTDKDELTHVGLPWAGCSLLAATGDQLVRLREDAAATLGVYIADMPRDAQDTRVYADYLAALSDRAPAEIDYLAVSLVGPRKPIDKLTKKLTLLS